MLTYVGASLTAAPMVVSPTVALKNDWPHIWHMDGMGWDGMGCRSMTAWCHLECCMRLAICKSPQMRSMLSSLPRLRLVLCCSTAG